MACVVGGCSALEWWGHGWRGVNGALGGLQWRDIGKEVEDKGRAGGE